MWRIMGTGILWARCPSINQLIGSEHRRTLESTGIIEAKLDNVFVYIFYVTRTSKIVIFV